MREYIHVLDAAGMSVDVLAPEFANQFIHLAGRERMTSRDMLNMISEIMGGDIELNFQATSPAGHYVQTPYNYTPKLGRAPDPRRPISTLDLGCWTAFSIIDHRAQRRNRPQRRAAKS